jgi:hypothetical protein
LLSRPDVWDIPPPDLEARIVTVIGTVAVTTARPVLPLVRDKRQERRERQERRAGRSTKWWLATAAACLVIVAGSAVLFGALNGSDEVAPDTEIALAGTDAAPNASAQAALSATPAGLKIVLDVDDLAPAPAGQFYEAWVSDGTIRVSAGTFHLRGGDKPIELWAGVVDPGFTQLAITLEPLDGNTDSSGNVQLLGNYDLGNG